MEGSTLALGTEDLAEQDTPPIGPFEFKTRRDHSLVVAALEHRLADLDKLAKKEDEEGYPSHGRKTRADAVQIRELVLPIFRAQQELPLASPADLLAMVRELITPGFTSEPVKDDTDVGLRDVDIINNVSGRIARALVIAATRGFWAGEAAREHDANAIALRAIGDSMKPAPTD